MVVRPRSESNTVINWRKDIAKPNGTVWRQTSINITRQLIGKKKLEQAKTYKKTNKLSGRKLLKCLCEKKGKSYTHRLVSKMRGQYNNFT